MGYAYEDFCDDQYDQTYCIERGINFGHSDCENCATHKKDRDDYEEGYNFLREELRSIVFNLSDRNAEFDYHKTNLALSSLCAELGVAFSEITVSRSQAFKINRS